MKLQRDRSRFIAAVLVGVASIGWVLACAQPPGGPDGPPPPPPGRGDAIRAALDVNGDHELDADEIKNASENLAKADRNGDGRIDHEEFRPPMPPMPRGEGGFRPSPPREGGFGGPPRPRDGEGPPRDGPRPPDGPPREGGPPRDGPPRDGPPFGGGGFSGERGPPPDGPPSPERFVERALTFDADGDGKLDRAELEKFAGEMMQRMRGGMPGRGPGERPERPRRPE
jgi:hypothetical protein